MQRRRASRPAGAAAAATGSAARADGDAGETKPRKKSLVSDHVRQMVTASTEAIHRPRKEREKFRRFIVDVVTQGECVPGGRKKVAAEEEMMTSTDDTEAAATADTLPSETSAASAPLTTSEKDLLR